MTAGDIYTVAGTGTPEFSGDGGPATHAELASPGAVAVDGPGSLVISDTGNNRIRVKAASTGTFYGQPMTARDIYTVAGTGTEGFSGDRGAATSADLATPAGVAMDAAGNLAIADAGNNRVRVVATQTGTFYGQTMAATTRIRWLSWSAMTRLPLPSTATPPGAASSAWVAGPPSPENPAVPLPAMV